MNIIGEVGNFIVKYQEPIQAVTVIGIAILVIFILCRLNISSREKRRWLKEINENVSALNANVKQLGEKKTEVIYIDGRVDSRTRPSQEAVEVCSSEEQKVGKPIQAKEEAAGEGSTEQEAKPCPTMKYHSRDCGVSKAGRTYTIEELNAQIKD